MGCGHSTNNAFSMFCKDHLLTYPGNRLFMSEIMIQWVWSADSKAIYAYISEEDPLNLKHIKYSITRTLDCIDSYRKFKRMPMFMGEEKRRYDQFCQVWRSGKINNFWIENEGAGIEYIRDAKLFG